jgi:hypothetical protein
VKVKKPVAKLGGNAKKPDETPRFCPDLNVILTDFIKNLVIVHKIAETAEVPFFSPSRLAFLGQCGRGC